MDVFSALALVVGLAALGGIIAKTIKQPVILGYIVAGLVLSHFKGVELSVLASMGKFGVTLLLFLVGLELPLNELKRLGKPAVVTGVSQIVLTTLAGLVLTKLLGFSNLTALYVSLGLTFGSTVIVVNLLAQKKDLQSLYGRLAVGFLLVQDLIAILILVFLSGLGRFVGIAILITLIVILSKTVLPRLLDWISGSVELLFIFSLGWCLAISALTSSPELGGFLAGLAMANTAQSLQIISRTRPIRDFFMTLFFVSLGTNLSISYLGSLILPAIILSLFVLIGNPLIAMFILVRQGYSLRVAFLASLTVAQVSEFSLIIMNLAYQAGHVPSFVLPLLAIVVMITMTVSSYLILHADELYKIMRNWFPKEISQKPDTHREELKGHVVLFGHNRIGKILLPVLEKIGHHVVVVDFDPEVITSLKNRDINAVYGDVSDPELYDVLHLAEADWIISTIADVNDSLQLLAELKLFPKRPGTIMLATDTAESKRLYANGADYVLVPHAVGGDFLAHILQSKGLDKDYLLKLRGA